MKKRTRFKTFVRSFNKACMLFPMLLLLSSIMDLYSQGSVITGKVFSENDGIELTGVNVIVKGTTIGTITNSNGEYKITVPDKNSTLQFSFIGYKNHEEQINGRTNINVSIEENTELLDEVVVTALNLSRTESSLGYSVTMIDSDELSKAKENNVMNSLAGKVAGLQISKSPSGVDGSTRVVLRGISSLTGNNRPLIVVDGVPVGGNAYGVGGSGDYRWGFDMGDQLADINPQDIESISVLKGAGASAAYGSRGGNGVILITTKKGTSRRGIGVSLNSSYTIEQPYIFRELQNEYGQGGFGSYPKDITSVSEPYNWSWGPKMDGRIVTDFLGEEVSFVPTGNPYKDYYTNGFSFENTIALDGGNANSNFRVSITNQNSEGIVPNNKLSKQTFNIRGFSKLGKLIELDSKITYIHHKANDRPFLGEDPANASYAFINMPRNISTDMLKNNTTDANGNEIWAWDFTSGNPYWHLKNKKNWDERNRFQGLLSIKFNLAEKLTLVTQSGLDFVNRITNIYGARGSKRIENGRGTYSHNWDNNIEWNTDALLTYKSTLSDNLKMNFSLGGNYRYNQGKGIGQSGSGWKVPDFYKMQNLETYNTGEGFSEKEVWSSYFLTNMQWKSYLYFDFTVRNDVSSTIPIAGGANSYIYHSENISFLFTELLNINPAILSTGKLRASYAMVGNDTGPYQTNNYYGLGTSPLPYPTAGISDQLAFYDLKPEMTYSWEAGTNLKFFNNMLETDFTYYIARTENQLMSASLAPSTGYSSRRYNAGEVQNNGFEAQINGSPISTSSPLGWNVTLNLSKNNSKVVSLYEGKTSLRYGTVPLELVYIEAHINAPFGQIYGFDYARDAGGNILVDNNGFPLATDELVALGDLNPDLMLGLKNDFKYKNINLNFLIDVQIGGEYYSHSGVLSDFYGTGVHSLEGRDEWYATHNGPVNSDKIPGVFPDGYIQEGVNIETGAVNDIPVDPLVRTFEVIYARKIMTDYIMDATNVRFREIVLSYQLPQKWIKNTFITNAIISLVGRNLFFFYNANPDLDPESGVTDQAIGTAMEINAMPGTRSFGFNLKLNM